MKNSPLLITIAFSAALIAGLFLAAFSGPRSSAAPPTAPPLLPNPIVETAAPPPTFPDKEPPVLEAVADKAIPHPPDPAAHATADHEPAGHDPAHPDETTHPDGGVPAHAAPPVVHDPPSGHHGSGLPPAQ